MWKNSPRVMLDSTRLAPGHVPSRFLLGTNETLHHLVVQKHCPPGIAPIKFCSSNCRVLSICTRVSCSRHGCYAQPVERLCLSDRVQNRKRMLSSDRKAGHGAVGSFLDESNKQGKISAESTNVVEGHSRTTNGLDQAALLRRVAKYIEEDATAADKLAAVMSPKDRVRLETTLNSMEYTVRQPNSRELRGVALISTVPFIGFGFMDNAIMVVAGEYIDLTVGIALGISTMAAAALGNTISDVAGVGLGGAIESLATRLGLPTPGLSRAQMRLRKTRIATIIGNAIGVAIGCLLGMFPLVFMSDPDAVEAVKRREKIVGLIDAVVEEASSFLSASSATLFILERETGVLWAHRRDSSGTSNTNIQDLKLHVSDSGPVSRAARSREAVNVAAGGRGGAEGVTSSALCMPVFAADGEVAGVVQVLGKRKHGTMDQLGFSADDAKKLSVLCSHISVALENIKRSDEADEVHLREVIALMRSYGGTDEDRPFLEHLSESTATPT